MEAIILCGFLAADSRGMVTTHETETETSPAAAAERGIFLAADANVDIQAEQPKQPAVLSGENDIGRLVARLKEAGNCSETSVLAAEALGKMGPKAEPAIDDLIESLADERRTSEGRIVADAAAGALAKIGRPAVAALVKALHSNDSDVRYRAAESLGQMGAEAKPAIAALGEALCGLPDADKSDIAGFQAAGAAAAALAKIGRPAVPTLANALHHGNEDIRVCALAALGELGSEAAAAAPDLKQLLTPEEPLRIRWRALDVYASAEPDTKEVVRLLSPHLRDRDARLRSHAAVLLGNLGPKAAAAVMPLMDGLNDDGWANNARLDPNFGISRPVCCDMAEALGKIGAAARPALPKLSAMMADDQPPSIRISATLAAFQIDPSNQKPLWKLVRILEEGLEKDHGGTIALEATLAIADVGPRGAAAVPALGKALRHKKFFLRQCAANALANIGGAEAVRFLIMACRDPNEMVRWSAVSGLGNLGAEAAPAVTTLVELLETAESDVESLAPYPIDVATIETLGAIGSPAASVIPALEKASQSEKQYLREAAIATLKEIRSTSAGHQQAEPK